MKARTPLLLLAALPLLAGCPSGNPTGGTGTAPVGQPNRSPKETLKVGFLPVT